MFGFLIRVCDVRSLDDVRTVLDICGQTLRDKPYPVRATCHLKKHELSDVLLLCTEPCATRAIISSLNAELAKNIAAVLPDIISVVDCTIPARYCTEFAHWAESLQAFGDLR